MDAAAPDLLRERHAEQAVIGSAIRSVADGDGRVLLVQGPPGIGKSTLSTFAAMLARGQGYIVLRARCGELERESDFGVVHQLLGGLLARARPDQRHRWLAGAARSAGAVLDAGPGSALTAPGPAVFHGLYWLLVNLADDAPLMVLVDDAQWADEASARFLFFLAARVTSLPVLLLLAARPGNSAVDALSLDPAALLLHPATITEVGVADWLADELGTTPPADVTRACVQATGGNPFLLHELVREIRSERVDLASGPGPVAALSPRAVTTAVLLRLAVLPPAATRLARAVAVLEATELDTAARVADLHPCVAGDALDHLVRADILTTGPGVAFVHPLVRQVVLQDLPHDRRQRLHARAAQILHERGALPHRVATHLLLAPAGLAPWALSVLRDTAARATELGSHTTAAHHLRRVLPETSPGPQQVQVLLDLGLAEVAAAHPEGTDHLAAALRVAATVPDIVRTSVALAGALRAASQGSRAVAVLHAAQTALADTTDPDGRLRTSVNLELLACTATSRAARLALTQWRAERVRDPGGVPATAWEALVLASVALDGALDAHPINLVLDQLARAVAAAPAITQSWLRGQVISMSALAYLCVEQFEPAGALIDRLVQVTTQQSLLNVLASTLATRASLELRRGNLDRATTDAHRALELAAETDTVHVALPRAGAVILSVAAEQNTTPPARLVSAELDDDSTAARLLAHSRAELLLAHGEDRRGVAELLAYGARNAELGWSGCATPWRSQAGLALDRLGEHNRGQALIAEELDLAHRSGALRAVGVATAATGLLATGPRRLELLTEAVQLLAGTGARLDHARALVRLGAELTRTGRAADARQPLRQAHDLALHCHATTLAAHASQGLRRAGARPRRTSLTGVDSLTPAEQRVAETVAAGHTNRHTAQQLFLTEKTIETHLARVFRKLGVRTRHELNAALHHTAPD